MSTGMMADADSYGDVRPADLFEVLCHYLRLGLGVADSGGNELDVEFIRLQQQCQRPCVVDIVTDIRVEDDGDLAGDSRESITNTGT